MKIAVIHTQLRAKGGMEAYLLELLRRFSDAGDEVDLYIYKRSQQVPNVPGVRIRQIPVLPFLPRQMRRRMFLHRLEKQFDASSYDLSFSLTRSVGQEVVICGGTHLGYIGAMKKPIKVSDKREIEIERRAYSSSKVVVAHSHLLRRELIDLYQVPEDKIRVLLPPVDLGRFVPKANRDLDTLAVRCGVDRSKRTLLFPSSGHTRKGFYELIDAFQQLDPNRYQLLVAGDTAIEAKRLPHVRYLGFVGNLEDYLALSDFMILPSHYEPYGLVVTEALACGVPVILSHSVGAGDELASSDVEFMDAVSPGAIVKTIERAFSREFAPVVRESLHDWKQHVADLKGLQTCLVAKEKSMH